MSEKGPIIHKAAETGKSGGGVEGESDFQESFIFDNEEEYKEVKSTAETLGKEGRYHRTLLFLHQDAITPGIEIDTNRLKDTANELRTLAIEEGIEQEEYGAHMAVIGEEILGREGEEKEDVEVESIKIENDEYGTPEVPDSFRPFTEIKADLQYFVKNPKARETVDGRTLPDVHLEHKQLAEIAKKIGIFEGIRGEFDGIKTAVNTTQEVNKGNFQETYMQIVSLDPQIYENQAKTQLHGWDDKFEGLIGTYHQAVLANMGLAWETANGRPDSAHAKLFSRGAAVWNYDTPPEARVHSIVEADLHLMKRRQEEERRSQAQGHQAAVDAYTEALAKFNVTPEKQREKFLEVEKYGVGEIQVPLTTDTIFEDLSPQEKTFWQARMALSNARSLRQAAISPDDLFPNDHIQKMTKGELKALDNVPGVVEAEEIYLIMATELDCTNIDGRNGPLSKLFREFKVKRTKEINGVDRIIDVTIKNLHDIKSEDELDEFRGKFREYLQTRFGLSEEQALDAEQIGFNKFIMSDINEYASSVDFERQNGRPTRERPKTAFIYNVLISPAQRDLMHPLEKAFDDNRDRTNPRSWPEHELGEFITAHPTYGADKIPLPYTLSKKSYSYYHDFDIPLPGGQQTTLYKHMKEDGMRLIMGNDKNDRARRVDWDSREGENPYYPYYLAKNKQLFVWNVLSTGELPRGKSMASLKNKLNDLDIDDDFREVLAYLLDPEARAKLEPTHPEFIPHWGTADFGIEESGFRDKFVKKHPGFFRTKHTQVSKLGRALGV